MQFTSLPTSVYCRLLATLFSDLLFSTNLAKQTQNTNTFT